MKRTGYAFGSIVALACVFAACDATVSDYHPPTVDLGDASAADGSTVADGSTGTDAATPPPPPPPTHVSCTTTFSYTPPAGRIVQEAYVTGEWNAFAKPGLPLDGPDANGAYTASVDLPPGLVAYRFELDGNLELDPSARWQKYANNIAQSGVRVPDCHVPALGVSAKAVQSPGHFTASIDYVDATDDAGLDPQSVQVSLRKDDATTPLTASVAGARIGVDANGLAPGKYSMFVSAADKRGVAAKTIRLVFWIEAEAFDWHDAVIYMAMTDRFKDGDPSNDAPLPQGIDPHVSFQGGDFEGVRQAIASGALDQLGVRAIWLTPFQTNPAKPYAAADGVHASTGYHGYWPIKAREVEPRIGGEKELKALVKEAHAHGIRILQDFVVNHVHKEHEYFTAHPEWFRTGCLCGTNDCDWTTHRLDCLFSDYLPDVNWTVPEVNEQYGDDAVWWLDTFDIDGLRIDAVKHVEDVATINLSARLRDEFELGGTRLFLTGETAMGWSDCGLDCNYSQYSTISRYVSPDRGPYAPGPGGLDGQFDFVMYYAVPAQAFNRDYKGMTHVDYWSQASGWEYPQGSIMTPYIGSHDTPRSVTLATYRDQDAAHNGGIPGNQWGNVATAPTDAEPYQRHRASLSWLLGMPGAPLIYYGDEYGEWGGADPNNRAMWRGDGALSTEETATLALARKLGTARRTLPALRRGDYRPIYADDSVLIFARQTRAGELAFVCVSRSANASTVMTPLPLTLPLPAGAVLHDSLGGPDVPVINGTITVSLPPRGAAILAP